MKTTVEIPNDLLRKAKAYAVRHRMPIQTLFELGLRTVLQQSPRTRRFRLKTITTVGEGLVGRRDWNAIRSWIYAGHGG